LQVLAALELIRVVGFFSLIQVFGAKIEHRNTKLTFEPPPEIQNIREKFVMDFYMVGNQQFLSRIDVYSKFGCLV